MSCRKCLKRNHFAIKCQSKPVKLSARTVDERDTDYSTEDDIETYPLQLHIHCLDDSQLITLGLESGSYVRFQVDTRAQCNMLPLHAYREATGDANLRHVTPIETQVTTYGGGVLPVIGSVKLKIWRDSTRYYLNCKLINSLKISAIIKQESMCGNEGCYIPR